MFNSEAPDLANLPPTRKLIRSTILALISAIVLLVTVILPAEYGIDPTGVGGVLNLTEMGEIKSQLAEEAEADRMKNGLPQPSSTNQGSGFFDKLFAGWLIGTANAQTKDAAWKDEITFKLTPGQGTEIKLVMPKGAKADFSWSVAAGAVNYDLHGDGGGKSISYKRGRRVNKHNGTLEAAFKGNHGWFWRNRGREDVSVTLRIRGGYTDIMRYK
jgi:hypothetical protein